MAKTAQDKDTLDVKVRQPAGRIKPRPALVVDEHTVEIVSDSGEGAQKCERGVRGRDRARSGREGLAGRAP